MRVTGALGAPSAKKPSGVRACGMPSYGGNAPAAGADGAVALGAVLGVGDVARDGDRARQVGDRNRCADGAEGAGGSEAEAAGATGNKGARRSTLSITRCAISAIL